MFAKRTADRAGGEPSDDVREERHVPVMVREVCGFLAGSRSDGLLVDGTAGMGGHLAALLDVLPDMRFLALDRDPNAVSVLRERFGDHKRVIVRHASYTSAQSVIEEIGLGRASAALFDLGLSSLQLDDPARGFSHSMDGTLDMRFDPEDGPTALELVNTLPEKELADIIFRFGQEGRSRRIAAAIVNARPVAGSRELADAVSSSVRSGGVKMLSRVFQALRIAVNRELEELDILLDGLASWTETDARIAFITFHSLEDRRVKVLFRDCGSFRQYSPKWLLPGDEEIRENSRARSARLRMGLRT
ncbi:MAG: hypothetical protein AVO35_07040 [Candidatus Aegiribacteria sp. MLS_C]|nr:MAG: hypothetical protein AVO35_07040 [Candidatus Aegiribacteria sp. MLS_C]